MSMASYMRDSGALATPQRIPRQQPWPQGACSAPDSETEATAQPAGMRNARQRRSCHTRSRTDESFRIYSGGEDMMDLSPDAGNMHNEVQLGPSSVSHQRSDSWSGPGFLPGLEEPETPEKRPLYVLPASGRRMAEDGEGCFDVEEFKPEPKYYERYFSQCEMIGKGSFAEVYRVIRRSDGAEFAVKISRHLLKGRSAWEKMASDFVYKGQLRHPNLVECTLMWHQSNLVYEVLELCGGTLQEFCDERRNKELLISENEVWSWITDIALGLRHLHESGLVHNDIKPDNILFSRQGGRLKLGDFGLTCPVNAVLEKGEGDARYLASEVLEADDYKSGFSSDIFSLGITIFDVCSTRRLPNFGDFWVELRKEKAGNLLSHRLYSRTLRTLVTDMMQSCAIKRPTIQQILEHKRVKQVLAKRGETLESTKRERIVVTTSNHRRSRSQEDQDDMWLQSPDLRNSGAHSGAVTCPPKNLSRRNVTQARRLNFDNCDDMD